MRRGRNLVRRVSAALIAVWLLVLVAAYVNRQLRRPKPVERGEAQPTTAAGSELAVRVHKGFVYSDTVGVEPNFRVAARETLEFVSGRFEMHDVEVTLYDAGEVAYGMLADVARLDPARREAEATGNARLSLGSGIAVHAEGFALHGALRLFESSGPVAFAGNGWGGTAARVTGSLADNTMTLEGGISASLRGAKATTIILAPRAHYARRRATVEFPEGLELRQDDVRLTARSASLLLAAPEKQIRRLVLEAPVALEGQTAEGTAVMFRGGRVELVGAGERHVRLMAESQSREEPVVLRVEEGGAVVRELATNLLSGEIVDGALAWLEGNGSVNTAELRPQLPARRVEADNIRVEFAAGRPRTAVARGSVKLADGLRRAVGEVVQYAVEEQAYVVQGTPQQRVRVTGEAFSATCDALQGQQGGGTMATGRVTGRAERRNADGTTETVNFAGDRVSAGAADEDPIVLEGDARLWQEDRLIRADRLEYYRSRAALRGSGNVTSIATFDRGQGGVEDAKVRARAVTYEREKGEASYEGDVELLDPRATVRCQRLLARLDARGNVQSAVLTGGVQITDTGSGRSVDGQRATFDPAADILDIWGMPVLAREPNGNQLKANHLRWYRGSGTFVVVGEEDNPSEALYHAVGDGKGLPVVRKTPPPPGRRPFITP